MTTSDPLEKLFRRESAYTCAREDCHCLYRHRGIADNAELLIFRCEIDCVAEEVIRGTEVIVSPRAADVFRCVEHLH